MPRNRNRRRLAPNYHFQIEQLESRTLLNGIGDPPQTLDLNNLQFTWLYTNPFGDTVHTDNIASAAEYDIYAFNADVSELFVISTTGPLDSQLQVYDSEGQPMGGLIDASVSGETTNKFLGLNHIYYIAVGGHDMDVGSYSLSINGPTSPVWSIVTPAPFFKGNTRGNFNTVIDNAGDHDFFMVVAPQSATSLDLMVASGPTADLLFEVYDANGAFLQMSNNGGLGILDTLPGFPVQGGATYYIAVGGVPSTTRAGFELTVDFAPNSNSSIRGAKLVDMDSDGVRDPGEPGIAGVTIYIDSNDNGQKDAGEPTTLTDADGNYEFTNLLPGTYHIGELASDTTGWINTLPGPSGATRLMDGIIAGIGVPGAEAQSLATADAAPNGLYFDEYPTDSGKIGPAFVITDNKWPQSAPGAPVTITYSLGNMLDGGLSNLTAGQIRAAIQEALALWATYAPLNFVEVPDVGPPPADKDYFDDGAADIRFGHHFIDGPGGGILAHSFFAPPPSLPPPPFILTKLVGDIHFDDANIWSIGHIAAATDIVETMVHEIGHSLGLDHEWSPPNGFDAIMYPFMRDHYNGPGTAFLFPDDVAGIHAIYGSVKARPGTWRVYVRPGETVSEVNFGIFPTIFNGTAASDDLAIQLAAGDPTTLRITHAGVSYSIKKALLNKPLTFNGLSGDDSMTIDSSNGYAVPPGGYTFNPGDGKDALILIGAAHNFLIDQAALGIEEIHAASGSQLTFYASQHLTSLVLSDNAAAYLNAPMLRTGSLSISNGAMLDMKDHALIIKSASISNVTNDIKTGRIRSSGNLPRRRIGAISNDGPLQTTFAGETGLTGGEILVLYTLIGDLNLDKSVSISDFIALAAHFNQSPATWGDGDLNGDGAVTISDFLDLAANFNQSFASATTPQPALASSITTPPTTKKHRKPHRHHRPLRIVPNRSLSLFRNFR